MHYMGLQLVIDKHRKSSYVVLKGKWKISNPNYLYEHSAFCTYLTHIASYIL